MENTLPQALRDYVDTFGFAQKNINAMDIIIEDTKSLISAWGGEEPDFMLVPPKLCFQLTMTQERTSYFAQGDDGKQLLKEGPILDRYRGLSVVKSRAFSMEEGSAPRDVLRRRVRTAEFYYGSLKLEEDNVVLYDEFSDNLVTLYRDSFRNAFDDSTGSNSMKDDANFTLEKVLRQMEFDTSKFSPAQKGAMVENFLLLRPAIEHYMLAAIIGKGGLSSLGATLWGQTELSVFDDGMHGVWGLTYKYHEKAM